MVVTLAVAYNKNKVCTYSSQFTSLAILDESADSKETVLKVVNILHEKFQVGICTDFVLIVGDGKSYDHLIKLKSEYGSNKAKAEISTSKG
jgi:hypothetical protein